jgi:hypothetical protein
MCLEVEIRSMLRRWHILWNVYCSVLDVNHFVFAASFVCAVAQGGTLNSGYFAHPLERFVIAMVWVFLDRLYRTGGVAEA